MEYLPEKKRTQNYEIKKREAKIRAYREYLADNDVVLAFTKLLLALRQSNPAPENPTQYVRDYFGDYRDPLWDEVDRLKTENKAMRDEEIPAKEAQIEQLERDIRKEVKKNRVLEIYKALDPDSSNAIGYKFLVNKLSGNAKFDLDTKLTGD